MVKDSTTCLNHVFFFCCSSVNIFFSLKELLCFQDITHIILEFSVMCQVR